MKTCTLNARVVINNKEIQSKAFQNQNRRQFLIQ